MGADPLIPNETPSEETPQPLPFLHIQMQDDGTVSVDGPLGMKGLCYSMLEQARDVILGYNNAQALKKIVKPNGHGGLLNHLRRFK